MKRNRKNLEELQEYFAWRTRWYVYQEFKEKFFEIFGYELEDGTKIHELKSAHRSLGVLEGELISYDLKKREGVFVCEGKEYPCKFVDNKRNCISKLLGEKIRYNFRPIIPEMEELDGVCPKSELKWLRLVYPRKATEPETNYVEVMGYLHRVEEENFYVVIWDFYNRCLSYVPFSGSYPYVDEEGEFIWVRGGFVPEKGEVEFQEAEAISFLSKEEGRQAKKWLVEKGIVKDRRKRTPPQLS